MREAKDVKCNRPLEFEVIEQEPVEFRVIDREAVEVNGTRYRVSKRLSDWKDIEAAQGNIPVPGCV